MMTADGVYDLMRARRELNEAHKAACTALARFASVDEDLSLPVEERVSARSLIDQTKPLCKAILTALQAIPEPAQPKVVRMEGQRGRGTEGQRDGTEGQKSKGAEGQRHRGAESVVATAARLGNPICA
jgi:hypothetical protein